MLDTPSLKPENPDQGIETLNRRASAARLLRLKPENPDQGIETYDQNVFSLDKLERSEARESRSGD